MTKISEIQLGIHCSSDFAGVKVERRRLTWDLFCPDGNTARQQSPHLLSLTPQHQDYYPLFLPSLPVGSPPAAIRPKLLSACAISLIISPDCVANEFPPGRWEAGNGQRNSVWRGFDIHEINKSCG